MASFVQPGTPEQELLFQLLHRVEQLEREQDAAKARPALLPVRKAPSSVKAPQQLSQACSVSIYVWDDVWRERGMVDAVPEPVHALLSLMASQLDYVHLNSLCFEHIHSIKDFSFLRPSNEQPSFACLPDDEAADVLAVFDGPLSRIR